MFYHHFVDIFVRFYLVGELRAKGSKGKRNGTKRAKNEQLEAGVATQESGAIAWSQYSQNPEKSMMRHKHLVSRHEKTQLENKELSAAA